MQKSIKESSDAVLAFLKGIPMSAATVRYYGSCYRTIGNYCQTNNINTFTESEAEAFISYQMRRHENGEINLVYALTLRKAAMMLMDCMRGRNLVWERRNYNQKQLCEIFEQKLNEYEASVTQTLAPGSVRLTVQVIRQFLSFLESINIQSFALLTAENIRAFIIEASPRFKAGTVNLTWPVKKFIAFLNTAGCTDIDAEKVVRNSAPKRKKVLPCFTPDEAGSLLDAVDTSTRLGKRDYAIMKVAYGTGLRGEDIFGLRLTDIDWRNNEISVVQSKTGKRIMLPLLPDVGNAVADYIMNARPKADSPFIFLRHRKPHGWLGNGPAGAAIIIRYQGISNFSRQAGDGKTFHAFRRTVGTALLKSETPLESVAQILGHARIESTKQYISMNDDMLQVCCMDMSPYATRKEGLA